jgi:phenylacetate-CoA ligase
LFWGVDGLKGGKVRASYDEIKSIIEEYDADQSVKKREQYLAQLLQHAVSSTPFYKNYQQFGSIKDFPVINKSIIRNKVDDFIAAGFQKETLHKVTTSGSTGTPFTVYHDEKKRLRHTADNIYFLRKAGFDVGERLYYMRVWNSINRKGWLKRTIENLRMEEIGELSREYTLGLIDRLEKDHSGKALLAFASTYEALLINLLALNKTQINTRVKTIVSMSESLPENVREQLMEIFNCPVVSRYSNMENGFLGQENNGNTSEYIINSASYFIEILQLDKDEPVAMEQAGRVVVTDLFNFAMPLIRYDTGDVATISQLSTSGIKGPFFRKIEGRVVDFIYSVSGVLLSPHVITNSMWKYTEVKQFQFIQVDKTNYIIKLNIESLNAARENELLTDLRQYVGEAANINIEYVHDIPLLASGKRKKIVNLMAATR